MKYIEIASIKASSSMKTGVFSKIEIPKNIPFSLFSGQLFNKGYQQEELINTQQKRIQAFMKNETNATKVTRFADSMNKFR